MSNLVTAGQSTTNRRFQYDITACWHCQIFSDNFLEKLRDKIVQEIRDRTASINFSFLLQESICILYFVCRHNVEFIKSHVQTIDNSCSHRLVLCTSDPKIEVGERQTMAFIPDSGNIEDKQSFEDVLLRKIYDILNGNKLYDDAWSSGTESEYSTSIVDLAAISTQTCGSPVQIETDDHIYDLLIPVVEPQSKTTALGGPQSETTASGRFIGAVSLKPHKREPQILDTVCLPSGNIRLVLIAFSLPVKAATLVFISGCGSAISSAKEG